MSKIIEENRIIYSLIKSFIFFINLINKIKRKYRKENRSIVIISYHKLGDSVFTIPTIEKIVEKYPENVNLFCMNNTVPVYNLVFGNSVKYFSFSPNDFRLGGRISKSKVRRRFKKTDASIIIDLTGSPKSVSTFIFNQAEVVIGFNRKVFKSLYTVFNSIDGISHVSEIYLKAVKGLIENSLDNVFNRFPIKEKITGDIVIHPFAGWASKEWGIRKFILLAMELNKIKPTKLILPLYSLSGDVKEEIDLLGIDILETRSVEELIEILKNAFLVIGNDSGAIYIANLLGIPTFTVFGPSNPSFHYLPSENSDFINRILPCSPGEGNKLCFTNGGRDGCPVNLCMNGLSDEAVYEKVIALIKRLDKKKSLNFIDIKS